MSRYHRLSIVQKRAEALANARENPVCCPACETKVMPEDLLPHMENRCEGPKPPGPGAKWVRWNDAMALGVPKKTLSRWAQTGQVRFLGERQDRKYLLRDLAKKIAFQRGFRRR